MKQYKWKKYMAILFITLVTFAGSSSMATSVILLKNNDSSVENSQLSPDMNMRIQENEFISGPGNIPDGPLLMKVSNNKIQEMLENAVVCGYIIDNGTHLPLENAHVSVDWRDNQGNYDWNSTDTDSTGFYKMNVNPGEIQIYVYMDGYFNNYSEWYPIEEYETFWINISIVPIPPENAVVCGYITDLISSDPLNNAFVDLSWNDGQGHYLWNSTSSNSLGFYTISTLEGYLNMYFSSPGYFSVYEELSIYENETLWINISLEPRPPETSLVCGYLTDKMTEAPITNAYVSLSWKDEYGNNFWNSTQTNAIGFYSMNIAKGTIRLYYSAINYSSMQTDYFTIDDYAVLWLNKSLVYLPQETAIICGYISDEKTHAAIKNTYITLDWKDTVGHYFSKSTVTSASGYFSITIPFGSIQMYLEANAYQGVYIPWMTISENDVVWMNMSLQPNIKISVEKPLPGLYYNNKMMLPKITTMLRKILQKMPTIIIGPVDIEVDVSDAQGGTNRVDFYIDGIYKATDCIAPYSYTWLDQVKFNHRHTIKIIAYDNAGPCDIQEFIVKKFF